MNKPQLSQLFREFVLLIARNPRFGKGRDLTVDQLKEELAIQREESETGRDVMWKPKELDQIEAELTALHLADDAVVSEVI